jgi:hypothetical protein
MNFFKGYFLTILIVRIGAPAANAEKEFGSWIRVAFRVPWTTPCPEVYATSATLKPRMLENPPPRFRAFAIQLHYAELLPFSNLKDPSRMRPTFWGCPTNLAGK